MPRKITAATLVNVILAIPHLQCPRCVFLKLRTAALRAPAIDRLIAGGRLCAETRHCRGGDPTRSSTDRSRLPCLTEAALPLMSAVALSKKCAGPKLPRNAKNPIQSGSGASVEPQRRSRAVFVLGDGFVQQCPDFVADERTRPTGLAQSVAQVVCRCSKEFRFQGVKQHRQSRLRIARASHGQDQAEPWRSMVRVIRRRVVSYSTAVISRQR